MPALTATKARPATHRAPAHPGVADGRHASYLGLGLCAGRDENGTVTRLHGLRRGRMVEIRLPQDDVESITWVLCALPKFKTVLGSTPLPAAIAHAVGDVPFFAPIWHGLILQGGEDGLVALRVGESSLSDAFLHDLWLLERIAANLALLPIPAGDLRGVPAPVTVPARLAPPIALAG